MHTFPSFCLPLRSKRRLLATIASCFLGAVGNAQSGWVRCSPATSPPARGQHSMVYDSARGRVVLFGGWDGTNRFGDTWEWDGQSWTPKPTGTAPSPRGGHAMAFDEGNATTLLFGGHDGTNDLDDTWEWDGVSWVQRSPTSKPYPRNLHAMAYDRTRQQTVLMGGVDSPASYFNDTWEWNGQTWQQLGNGPWSSRAYFSAAYHAGMQRTVFFGGTTGSESLSDTWEWNGSTWINATPLASPAGRRAHALAYDSSRGVTVVFGGYDGTKVLSDTWEWDGSVWAQSVTCNQPSPRNFAAMTYDAARGRLVLFGGWSSVGGGPLGDTWEYVLEPAAFTEFGQGCPGSAGTPALSAAAPPRLGQTFGLSLSNLPALAGGALLFGSSSTTWNNTPLPLGLAFVGMPGCSLYVSPDVSVSFTADFNGTAAWQLAIPNDCSLLGLTFFAQAFVGDAGASTATKLTVTNAGQATIGL